ncbi:MULTISPECIES: 4-(cytidine 5'-diphospho)-2-C-methyl-D-erythritol kinase [unclassified Roseateles]|uniref:4-(cytidine 5'-diphospho)-2-C-methyl-D-erythritol kinase n=1 Tax=unclassified Roseateles TaxID=2626991 RepID=UPI0006F43244|nr:MULTISPECIES: 4-(cytidine 5'-diphospho)-2-C-methyl-D-erythritol kinase [unclassified Roseateles]KQW42877.1 4-diphosphocytidyl-2C-methyl-D-erythritol kinase [Pelomonas sp. Root405]KRA69555.1 4-diphosphocytidyl-2C-methyl-D-erythritol kinase [Pelomonas sp. Root662]
MKALHDLAAPAKLNLFLHVVGKRPDGYHLLQSLFVLIDWADTLHVERRDDGRLARHDVLGGDLPADDLCLRAARLLQTETGCALGADIHLEKRLPAGAGMGGGSSDAATTLLALNRLWDLRLPLDRLMALGLKLGADVPFFLGGGPAFVEGIGEVLHPLTLPDQRFAVIKGPTGLATKDIFSSPLLARSENLAIVAGFPALAGTAEKLVTGFGPDFGRNDLQPAAESISSEVRDALALMSKQFGNARMTGSGAAVFSVLAGNGEDGKDDQSLATLLQAQAKDGAEGWTGRICRSMAQHPLAGWAG